MALVCSKIAVTWHDGLWPSTAGARVLLSPTDKIDESSLLPGSVEQLVQRAAYVRGETPALWGRGNRSTALEWDRARSAGRHDEALAMGLDAVADLPTGTGWVLVELPDYGRQWAIAPAVVQRSAWRYDLKTRHLMQRWEISMGIATEIANDAPDGAITTETGLALVTEDGGFYLAMES